MELEKYGFVQAGEWILSRGVGSGIDFKLTGEFEKARVVYAFVVNNEVKYTGICERDNSTLKARLRNYRSGKGRPRKTKGGENTNKHKASRIKQCLEAGKAVLIYALEPKQEFRVADIQADLVKGLENPLIAKFKPEWNRQKTL